MSSPTLLDLRNFAINRSLFSPTTLGRAISRLGFVQADPIRAPARAQDLTLRHRVNNYRAGDLEKHYPNWFGGQSNVTTKLLDKLHFHGLLRVARRDAGTRVYALRDAATEFDPDIDTGTELDGLIDVIVNKYAPLPAASLGQLVTYLMRGVPQHKPQRNAALQRAKARLAHTEVDGVDWYWPANEKLGKAKDTASTEEVARLLAPFDPIVWDRRRFSLFWGWDYRFEAYTPAPKRKLGYYAMPLLWRGEVIGWGNAAVTDAALQVSIGLVGKHRVTADLKRALDAEVDKMATFLGAQQLSWSFLAH